MKKTSIFIVPLLILANAIKAEDDSAVALDSTTVVAVANKQLRPIMEVVGAVSVISADDIVTTNSENMADALRYESNIHIENAGTRFGSSGINIRGVGKNRVAIEIDGITNAKQFSIGTYSNATAQLPETDLIKSIEILNGPASTLYGSDAIGGIVSIQTWNPEDLTRLSDNNRYNKIRLGYDGKTHGRVIAGMTAWDNDSFGSIVAFTQRDGKGLINHESVRLARDFSNWDEQTFFSKFVVNTFGSDTFKVGITATQRENDTQINSFIGQGRFLRTTELSANDNSNNYKLTFDYDFNLTSQLFDDAVLRAYIARTSFEQDTFEKRTSRGGTPLSQFRYFEYNQQNTGIELNLNRQYISNAATHNLIYGIEFTTADIKELRDGWETNLTTGITIPMILGEMFPRRDFPNSVIKQLGIFVLDEITIEDSAWTIIPAIRFDYYDLKPTRDAVFDTNGIDTQIVAITETDISPKLGVMYELNDNSNIYLQYVRGFRAPPFDDVNIGLNMPMFNLRAIANPDLKSETSDGLELGYRYFGETHQFNLTLFNTDYNNFIETKARVGIDPETGTILFQSRNIDAAEIYGIELAHKWHINNFLSSYTSMAWTHANNKTNNQPLNTISPAKVVNNLRWSSANNLWKVNLYSTFNAALNRVDETNDEFFKPAGFVIFDLFTSYKITNNQHLRLGIFNLTDKKYWNWQQVRNFAADEPIIDALSQPSRNVSLSYSIRL
ncbi:hypothetical protein MNBD_GAMMA01-224 [hydrothermal vent metagenome]|uniref:Uncharacterized protein n=1 Tax=hydrothermal vent metagenome TaxID=652676 RepID=A0A3B0VHS2_9ZZZZ